MKAKYLLLNIALLNEGVPALVETIYDTPADIKRLEQHLDEEPGFNYRYIQVSIPAYVQVATPDYIRGMIDPYVRHVIGDGIDSEVSDYEVLVVNHPREGFTVAVIPTIAKTFKVIGNFGDTGSVLTSFQDALNETRTLKNEEGITFIDIDAFDAEGEELGTFSYWDADPEPSVHLR